MPRSAKIPADLPQRLLAANNALECFAKGTTIFYHRASTATGFYVQWQDSRGRQLDPKRWMTMRGQDFYPPWHRRWGHGGTASIALAQLIRWCQGKPVLPLSTWRHWMGEKCKLGRDRGRECIDTLAAAGYPEEAICVLCQKPIESSMDWWSLNGISGPCCGWTTGCRQKGQAVRDAEESQLAAAEKLLAKVEGRAAAAIAEIMRDGAA